MVAVGMLLIWGGYSVSLWGWCLLRDYDVTLGQLMSPVHPYGQGKGQGWPPPPIPDTQIWPGGKTAARTVSQVGAPGVTLPPRQQVVPAPGNPTAIFPVI